MITKQEILQIATDTNLSAQVIEKDYVLGWILAGINRQDTLGQSWVFKGGTCLKKCYFETYRFSEDLDFTLKNEASLEENFLEDAFSEISEWVYEESGIELPVERMIFDRYKPGSCQGRESVIYFV
jgi:predicted nucleotidyltransferase component of viral defense system